jgi:hypothetical protein
VKNVVKRLSLWVTGSTALIAGLSTHGLVAAIIPTLLAVIIPTLFAVWITSSDARATRVTGIISACRGDAKPLSPDSSSAAFRPRGRRVASASASSSGREGDGLLRQQEAVGTVKVSSKRPSDNTVVPQARRSKQVGSAAQGRAGRPRAYRAPRAPSDMR